MKWLISWTYILFRVQIKHLRHLNISCKNISLILHVMAATQLREVFIIVPPLLLRNVSKLVGSERFQEIVPAQEFWIFSFPNVPNVLCQWKIWAAGGDSFNLFRVSCTVLQMIGSSKYLQNHIEDPYSETVSQFYIRLAADGERNWSLQNTPLIPSHVTVVN